MDETAVSVRGGAHYLYRAVDKHGKTVDSFLCTDRSESAARAFFRTAAVTLAGVELAHRIRKRQFSFGRAGPRRFSSLKHLWAHALARISQ
jgi:DDE domain